MIKKKKESNVPILNMDRVYKEQLSITNLINKTELESPHDQFQSRSNMKRKVSYGMDRAILEIQNKLEDCEI